MKKKLKIFIPICILAVMICIFFGYTGIYYHADATVLDTLESDSDVSVAQTDYGWFFDGPSVENILVFYPGAKVEEKAYAPLLHHLAAQGMDSCLVKMPFRLAFFGANKADVIFANDDHPNRYIGGHSLGGAFAANYAAKHGAKLDGVILLAAYPTNALDDSLQLLSIYGSEDSVLNMSKVEEGRQFASNRYAEQVIEGGNHAQFGNYGTQKGDGKAVISSDEQQQQTIDFIFQRTLP